MLLEKKLEQLSYLNYRIDIFCVLGIPSNMSEQLHEGLQRRPSHLRPQIFRLVTQIVKK